MQGVNVKRTFDELGIDVSSLKPNSEKLIYRTCQKCGDEELRPFRYVTFFNQTKCLKCSNQINGENGKEKIKTALIKWNTEHAPVRLGKHHSKKTRTLLSKFRSGKCFLSEEQKHQMSLNMKGSANPFFGKRHSSITLRKLSRIATANARRGSESNFYGKTFYAKSTPYTRRDGRVVKLKSSWELKTAIYLDKNNISWEYEQKSFPLTYRYEGKLKSGTYIPDFFLKDEIWEVKGYWRKDAEIKFKKFKKIYPHLKIKLLQKKELRAMGILP